MDLKIGGQLGYWLLRKALGSPKRPQQGRKGPDQGAPDRDKLDQFFGPAFIPSLAGKTVLDYGCGHGRQAVDVALGGARHVYGVDVRDGCLAAARLLAAGAGVTSVCTFLNARTDAERLDQLRDVDCAYSLDSFEHFAEPEQVLIQIRERLAPGGRLYISFGPPWKHPRGCHMMFFRPVPWMHLIFREETIMAVRALYKSDGARRFEEVEGGLNRMTICRFVRLVTLSGYRVEKLTLVPIKTLGLLARMGPLREYFTSVVTCTLLRE